MKHTNPENQPRPRRSLALIAGLTGAAALAGVGASLATSHVGAAPSSIEQAPAGTAQANKADPYITINTAKSANLAANTILGMATTLPSAEQHWDNGKLQVHTPQGTDIAVSVTQDMVDLRASEKTPAGYDYMDVTYQLTPATQAMTATNLQGVFQSAPVERFTLTAGSDMTHSQTLLANQDGGFSVYEGSAVAQASTETLEQERQDGTLAPGHSLTDDEMSQIIEAAAGTGEALQLGSDAATSA